MRPVYETEADREHSRRIAQLVAVSWGGLTVHELKRLYPIDFAFFDHGGFVHSWNEVKCRNGKPHDFYRTVILSLHKLTFGVEMARDTGAPFNLLIEFADGIWYCPVNGCRYPVKLAGRTDRGDTIDIEPCAYIPVSLFKRI